MGQVHINRARAFADGTGAATDLSGKLARLSVGYLLRQYDELAFLHVSVVTELKIADPLLDPEQR